MKRSAGVATAVLALAAVAAWLVLGSAPPDASGDDAVDGALGSRREPAGVLHAAPAGEAAAPVLPPAGTPREPLPPAVARVQPPPPSATAVAGLVVRVARDTPLRGAQSTLLGPATGGGPQPVLATAVTPDDGTFHLDGAPVRPVALVVTWQSVREVLGEGHAFEVRVPREPVTVRVELPLQAPLPESLRVPLDTGWLLEGRVLDAQGEGVPGAFVLAGEHGPEARTALDGSYSLADLPALTQPMLVTTWAPFRVRRSAPVGPPPPGTWRLVRDVPLPRAGAITGFVIDSAGRSVVGAVVLVTVGGPPDGSRPAEAVGTTAGAGGRYLLEDLPEGRFDVLCTWFEHVPGTEAKEDVRRAARVSGVEVHADATTIADIRLDAGTTLSGRALDRRGDPVRYGVVEYWSTAGPQPSAAAVLVQARERVQADGRFTLLGVHPGPGELRLLRADWRMRTRSTPKPLPWARQVSAEAAAESFDWVPQVARRIDLPPGGLQDVELRVDEAQARVSGVVTDVAGAPLAGVSVTLSGEAADSATASASEANARSEAVTDAEGRFELPGGHGEPCSVRLALAEHLPAVLELPAIEGPVDVGAVVQPRAPAWSLLVVDHESGQVLPQASATLFVYGGGLRDAVVHVAPLGDAAVVLRADRTEGRRVLLVEAPEHRPWRQTDVLGPTDAPVELVVRLGRR